MSNVRDRNTMVRFCLLLLVIAGTCIADISSGSSDVCASGGNASVDCGDAEGASYFLQMSSNSMRGNQAKRLVASTEQLPVTTIEPFECLKFNNPVQILKDKSIPGFAAKLLNLETGKYDMLYPVPFGVVPGGYKSLNACGINPMDNIVYCHMKMPGKSYVVRVDKVTVEFVANVPPAQYQTGSFSPAGDMFIAAGQSDFLVVKDLNNTKGYTYADIKQVKDLSKTLKRARPKDFKQSADCVVVDKDLDRDGTMETYVVVLYGPRLQIAEWKGDSFGRTWIYKVIPDSWSMVYGAGWSFQGKIFFAANNGKGVYRVPFEDLDPKDTKTVVKLEKISESEASTDNDGLNCINGPDPFTTQVGMFDCTQHYMPVQLIKKQEGYAISELNFTTGNYTPFALLPYNITSPPFKELNAAGIDPKDGIAYGALKISSWPDPKTPAPFNVVRFQENKLEFVAKVYMKGRGDAIAGAFDVNGTFYVVANPLLYAFPNISEQLGFNQSADPKMPVHHSYPTFDLSPIFGGQQVADIVFVDENFDGKGTATYMLAVNQYQKLGVVKINKENITASQGWLFKTNNVTLGWMSQNWGAAWNYGNNAYFANNDGAGVFKLTLSQITGLGSTVDTGKTVNLVKVGMSVAIHDNDGFNCYQHQDPFAAAAGPSRL